MVYIPGGSAAYGTLIRRTLLKEGEEEPLGFPGGFYGTFELAPDGRRIAIVVWRTKDDIWVFDLKRPNQTRLTSQRDNRYPLWTPDGESVIFSSDRHGKQNLFRKSANRGGDVERLTTSTHDQYAEYWSADGKWLAFSETNSDSGHEIKMLSVDTKQQRPSTQDAAGLMMMSPDGRWLAYTIFEAGRNHVFVQRFPGPGRAWQVSTEAGEEPVWSPRGDQIYYRNGRKWMAVAVETERELTLGTPQLLFEGDYLNVPGRSYDITPDGKHLILLRSEEDPAPTQVHVLSNWFDQLRRLAPPGGG